MAYLDDPNDEENNAQGMNAQKLKDQQQGQQQLAGGIDATAPISTGSQSVPKATSSGMTGFQNYQKANAGTATSRLGNAANKNVSNQAQTAKTGINQATTAFGQKVDAGSLANRDTALSDVKNVVQSARNVTAPAAATTAPAAAPAPQAAAPVNPATNNAAIASLAPEQTSRFQDVINAKYQGPESLRQAGDYQKAANKVTSAQTALDQSKTAEGREALLKNIYSQGGNYNQGLNKLDAGILNSSKQGVSQLANTAAQAGNIQGQLDQAQIASANLASNRGQEIADIRNQSRDAFTTGKAAEEQATEDRLSSVIKDWDKLPEYFKNLVRNGGTSALNSLEAQTLGIQNNEGLYNLGADAIATGVADKQKLITRDEQARQAALAALGGLDQSQLLNTNLNYQNADAAGTQSALDALDLKGTRANLNSAEQAFRDSAKANDITGYGSKKNKTNGKRYYAEKSANLGDLLQNSGYDLTSKLNDTVGNADLLKNLPSSTSSSYDEDPQTLIERLGFGDTANIGNSGQSAAGTAIDANPVAAGVNAVTNLFGGDTIGQTASNLFGAGSNSRQSKNIAIAQANKDLNNKVQTAIDASGYNNRAQVVNNDQTTGRIAALQQLLANLDKSNT